MPLVGVLGLAFGIWIGTLFLKNGYNLGRTQPTLIGSGWVLPLTMLGLLALVLIYPQIDGQNKSGVLFYSLKGPGAMHAPLLIALAIGLGIGFIAPTGARVLHHGSAAGSHFVWTDSSVVRFSCIINICTDHQCDSGTV